MKDSGSNERFYAIVVGNCTDEFIRSVVELLGGHAIDFVLCGDIYSAAGRLAKDQDRRNILVIGRIRNLSKEKGRFLEKVAEKGLYCCCCTDDSPAAGHKYWNRLVSESSQGSVFAVNNPEQVREVITRLSSGERSRRADVKRKSKFTGFSGEQFRASKAELEALLGGQ